MNQQTKKVSLKLVAGIFMMPYIFAWITLLPGYSKLSRILSLGWLLILFIAILQAANSDRNHENSNAKTVITTQNQEVADPTDPTKMHMQIHADVAEIDSVILLNNIKSLLQNKRMNRIDLYNYIENNYDTLGVRCPLPICENLRYAMRTLKSVAKNPNDFESAKEVKMYLEVAEKEAQKIKKGNLYKLKLKKPMFITQDGILAIESEINSRNECKMYGDLIHISQKVSIIVFVKPGARISKSVSKNDLKSVNCIYRYNFGGNGYTQVLMENETFSNWN